MWTIEEVKTLGRNAFKSNYWSCVIVAFILSLFTMGATYGTSNSTVDVSSEGFSTLSPEQQAIVFAAVAGTVLVVFAICLALRIFVFNPLEVGCHQFFKKNAESSPVELGIITTGFGDYSRVFITLLLRDLFTFLWTLLLIVPGIMKAYSYSMVPYILKDNPELSPSEVLARSEQMMMGNRWQAFCMDLSFIGWILLGVLTLNIVNIFWTNPYMCSTHAALYLRLKEQM